jgi:hypothetical protein
VKVGHRQAVTPENPRRSTAAGVFAFAGIKEKNLPVGDPELAGLQGEELASLRSGTPGQQRKS